jgi:hypothetical protein
MGSLLQLKFAHESYFDDHYYHGCNRTHALRINRGARAAGIAVESSGWGEWALVSARYAGETQLD